MKIETTPFVTTVTDAHSLFEVFQSRDRLGTPCMLLVYLTDGFFLGEPAQEAAVTAWLTEAPFLTAAAAEDPNLFPASLLAAFDLRISARPFTGQCPAEKRTLLCGRNAEQFCMLTEEAESFPAGAAELTDKLFAGKTPEQAAEITACFICARQGSAQDVLNRESFAFYRLMGAKNGGNSHV